MSEVAFEPFYERWADRLGLGVVGKLLLSVAAALVFFLPYYARVGTTALHNWSWLLAFLIACVPIFLFFATATLRQLFPLWEEHCEEPGLATFLVPLNRVLSDRNFVLAGLGFGLANTAMGALFGVSEPDPVAALLLFAGYFIAGFICGLPAWGIFGVVTTFRKFTRAAELKLDYTAPDRCGGLSFFGAALVKFSVVTLAEGGLIATYILMASWTRESNPWVQLVMWSWIVFPFLLSLLVLLVPALDLNRMLSRYRHDMERELKNKCAVIRRRIEESSGAADLERLHSEYGYLCSRREEVHGMRNWPFSLGATTSFAGAFVSNLVIAVELGKTLFGA